MFETEMDKERKTIFIVNQNGFMTRFILRSGILEFLKKSFRVVILTPNSHEKYFIDDFSDENVLVESLHVDQYAEYEQRHPMARFLRNMRLHCMPYSSTSGLRRRSLIRGQLKRGRLKGIIGAFLTWFLAFLLEKSKIIRNLLIKMECKLFCPTYHKDMFDKYHPSAIIVSSLGYFSFDHFLMRQAKKWGVKIIATLLSWDNTTSKGLKGAEADRIIAWTDNMKEELVKHYDENNKKIRVGGIPHFDIYFHQDNLSKKEFLKKYSLSPNRRIILYATRSPNKYPWNSVILKNLIAAAKENRYILPVQILVRIHPLHYDSQNGILRYESILNDYQEIERENPGIVRFIYPNILSKLLRCDMPQSDMQSLKEILKFSDVMLSNFSTMMIEASIFDLPFVNIAIYGHNEQIYEKDFAITFVHLRRIMNAGVVAYTFSELIDYINDYLTHPEKQREERAIVVQSECGVYKGKAAQRIAEVITAEVS
jgi:CDP-glycerol glycerophosphotransferase (TagB/SpsB family)